MVKALSYTAVECSEKAGSTDGFDKDTLKVDSTSPTVSLDAPSNNTWDNDGSIMFGFNDFFKNHFSSISPFDDHIFLLMFII